jgi:hypothetical protein
VDGRIIITCLSNLSISSAQKLTEFDAVDVDCAAQHEEDDCGDAQVDDDGDADAGKNSSCHHHVQSAMESAMMIESIVHCSRDRGKSVLLRL